MDSSRERPEIITISPKPKTIKPSNLRGRTQTTATAVGSYLQMCRKISSKSKVSGINFWIMSVTVLLKEIYSGRMQNWINFMIQNHHWMHPGVIIRRRRRWGNWMSLILRTQRERCMIRRMRIRFKLFLIILPNSEVKARIPEQILIQWMKWTNHISNMHLQTQSLATTPPLQSKSPK